MPVNPTCRAPDIPAGWWWLSWDACLGCGQTYAQFRSSASFSRAAAELRAAARGAGDPGGGFRSRGPVLWRMRTTKMSEWVWMHSDCCPF